VAERRPLALHRAIDRNGGGDAAGVQPSAKTVAS
jgi:hypothetical protein